MDGYEVATLEMRTWTQLAKVGVLIAPGWFFSHIDDVNELNFDREGHRHVILSFETVIKIFEKTPRQAEIAYNSGVSRL